MKVHGKDYGPNGIPSRAEDYIILHETHHSPFIRDPGPKIAPIILNPRVDNWGNFGPRGTSNRGMVGFMNDNVSFSAGSDSIGTGIFSMNLQGKLVFDL